MKYYELWLALANWKQEFSTAEFRSAFASPDPNKVLHDMTKKGFLESSGWGRYRVLDTASFFRKRSDIAGAYELVNEAKMPYAFTEKDAVFIWTKGGYQVDRSASFYPIYIKVRKPELGKWKRFFKAGGRAFYVFGRPIQETLFGIFYVLYPERRFKTKKVDGFSAIPLRETVNFCTKNIYSYEPALEMLNEMYGLGLDVKYRETKTNM